MWMRNREASNRTATRTKLNLMKISKAIKLFGVYFPLINVALSSLSSFTICHSDWDRKSSAKLFLLQTIFVRWMVGVLCASRINKPCHMRFVYPHWWHRQWCDVLRKWFLLFVVFSHQMLVYWKRTKVNEERNRRDVGGIKNHRLHFFAWLKFHSLWFTRGGRGGGDDDDNDDRWKRIKFNFGLRHLSTCNQSLSSKPSDDAEKKYQLKRIMRTQSFGANWIHSILLWCTASKQHRVQGKSFATKQWFKLGREKVVNIRHAFRISIHILSWCVRE